MQTRSHSLRLKHKCVLNICMCVYKYRKYSPVADSHAAYANAPQCIVASR